MNLTVHTDIDDCRRIWEAAWPVRGLFDLWQVREAFHLSFNRPLRFQAIEENGRLVGFLPLSWCEEAGSYVIFPGETWEGKTWLEQNRIIARDREVFQRLIDAVPGPLHMRYLSSSPLLQGLDRIEPDETGYLFYPGLYENDFNQYWMGFSGKTRKKIRHDCLALERSGVSFRFNRREDLDLLFRLNTRSFSERSYFHDPRFKDAFERLADHLDRMGMIRITTICIGREVAAVDMGAIFNQTYTLLAGGTDGRFKGVAKLINLHHIEWACQKQFNTVDFLCGDFNWKQRFHLSPTPLFKLDETRFHAVEDFRHEEPAYA